MQAVKDFVIKIGFDYDKGGQKNTEEGLSKITAGAGVLGSALSKAESQAKKSLDGVSRSLKGVDSAVTAVNQGTKGLSKLTADAGGFGAALSKAESQAKKSLDGVSKSLKGVDSAISQGTKGLSTLTSGAETFGAALSKVESKATTSLDSVSKSLKGVDSAVTEVSHDTKGLSTTIDKANQEAVKDVKEIDNAFGGLGATVSKVKGLIIALIGGMTVSNLVGYVTAAADKFEELSQTAKDIGTSNVENLASMQYAFSQFGVEINDLNNGLKNMTDYIGQAKLGEGEGLEVFKALKISVTDTNGKARDTIEIFDELIDKMSSLDHATQVTYINMLGLDTEMIKGMTANKEQLDEFRKQFLDTYAKAGVNINEVAGKSVAFNQSLRALKNTIQTIKDAIGARFLDVGIKTFDRLRVIATDNMDKIIDTATKLIDILYSMFTAVVNLGKMFIDMISKVIDWWDHANETFKTVVIVLGAITAALVVLNSEFMKSPIGRFITLMLALAALIEDYQKWKEGSGKTVLGRLLGDYPDFMQKLEEMTENLGIFKGAVLWAAQNLDILLASLAALPLAFKLLKSGVSGVNLTLQVFGSILKAVKDGLGLFKGALSAVLVLLKPVGVALKFLIGLVPLLISGLAKLTLALFSLPIGWVLAIIAAIIAAIWLIWDNWDVICEYLGKAWDWILDKFNSGINFLSGLFGGFFDWLSEAVDFILKPFKELWNLISDIGSTLKSKFSGLLAKFGIDLGSDTPDQGKADPQTQRATAQKEVSNTQLQSEQIDVGTNLIDVGNGLGDMVSLANEKIEGMNGTLESVTSSLKDLNNAAIQVKESINTVNETAAAAKDTQEKLSNIFNRTENDNRSYTDQSNITINVKDGNEAQTVINNVTRRKSGSRNNFSHAR